MKPAIRLLCFSIVLTCFPSFGLEPFEFHVHGDEVAEAGHMELELQANTFLRAPRQAEPDAEPMPDGETHFNLEPVLGLGANWEVAGHLLMGLEGDGTAHLAGGKVRVKYAVPKEEGQLLSYSLNGEVGYLSNHFTEEGWGAELRPAICLGAHKWHWHLNPVLGWSLGKGEGLVPELEFATRMGYELAEETFVAAELYSEFGKLNGLLPASEQQHLAFLAGETKVAGMEVGFGLGRGLTATSPTWVAKFQVGVEL